MKTPVRIAIVGMGGFAGSHHSALARLEDRGRAKLVCTCDPNAATFEKDQNNWRLAARGVQVFSDYRAMLDACHRELDLVVIPTPIQLHAPMHQAATAYGIPTYLEKPPTLDHAELDRMIAADARARKPSLVGFNFILEKARLDLKTRLLSGEFGAIRGATLSALWPRPAGYFWRNDWAGQLMLDNRIVLDSCFGNAMAHFVHNLLFWTGTPDLFSWAKVVATRAELYRGHAIEGADTFFVETDTEQGITLRFAVSHACAGASAHCEMVLCDKATLHYSVGHRIEVRWRDGGVERLLLDPFDPLIENYLEYLRFLHGETSRPATTLADCRPFVTLNDLAYVSSRRIIPIPPHLLTRHRDEKEQKDYLQVSGMSTAHEEFLTRGIWPGSNGWGHEPPTVATPADLDKFEPTIRAMVEEAKKVGQGARE